MELQIGVKVLIKNSEGCYLFLRRHKLLSTDITSSWDIPGGRINSDESLTSALAREVEEEIHHTLTTELTLITAQDIFVDATQLHVVRLTYTTTSDVHTIALSDEHEEYTWRRLEDTKDLTIEPYLQEVITMLCPQSL